MTPTTTIVHTEDADGFVGRIFQHDAENHRLYEVIASTEDGRFSRWTLCLTFRLALATLNDFRQTARYGRAVPDLDLEDGEP